MKKVNSDKSIDNVDVVAPKVTKPPDPDVSEFDALIEQARKRAKKAKLKKIDITTAIAKARKRK